MNEFRHEAIKYPEKCLHKAYDYKFGWDWSIWVNKVSFEKYNILNHKNIQFATLEKEHKKDDIKHLKVES